MGQGAGSGHRHVWSKSQFCLLTGVALQVTCSASLGLSFLFCKMGMIVILPHRAVVRVHEKRGAPGPQPWPYCRLCQQNSLLWGAVLCNAGV